VNGSRGGWRLVSESYYHIFITNVCIYIYIYTYVHANSFTAVQSHTKWRIFQRFVTLWELLALYLGAACTISYTLRASCTISRCNMHCTTAIYFLEFWVHCISHSYSQVHYTPLLPALYQYYMHYIRVLRALYLTLLELGALYSIAACTITVLHALYPSAARTISHTLRAACTISCAACTIFLASCTKS
jgi:hypothetical protein